MKWNEMKDKDKKDKDLHAGEWIERECIHSLAICIYPENGMIHSSIYLHNMQRWPDRDNIFD